MPKDVGNTSHKDETIKVKKGKKKGNKGEDDVLKLLSIGRKDGK